RGGPGLARGHGPARRERRLAPERALGRGGGRGPGPTVGRGRGQRMRGAVVGRREGVLAREPPRGQAGRSGRRSAARRGVGGARYVGRSPPVLGSGRGTGERATSTRPHGRGRACDGIGPDSSVTNAFAASGSERFASIHVAFARALAGCSTATSSGSSATFAA